MIDVGHSEISISRQCELLSVPRSSFYYKPTVKNNDDEHLMQMIDEIYTNHPYYGRRRMTKHLQKYCGLKINKKKVDRLMTRMGLEAIYPKKNLSNPNIFHKKYPYLLSGVEISKVNQVWSTDITYVRLAKGFAYLCAVIDWNSRYVLSWKLSNTMESSFCIDALEEALTLGKPEIFNTDQGSQFTSSEFTGKLASEGIRISMDGRGRALDNVFVERLWRSVKYENIYPNCYETISDARSGITEYFRFYNNERLHQSLNYETPASVYWAQITKEGSELENSFGLRGGRSFELCCATAN